MTHAPDPKTPRAPGSAPPEKGAMLPLPHETDESTGSAGSKPRKVIEQAAKDLAEGQVDTDMRATPGLDADRRAALVRGKR